MGHLRIKANECKYKERDRRLKEQFINGINDDDMMTEIISELSVFKKADDILVNRCWVGLKQLRQKEPRKLH